MIAVVHLVWAPLGPTPLREFLRSYHAHPAGAEHELAIVLNGAGPAGPSGDASRAALLGELQGTEHRLIELARPTLDLAAYGHAARELDREHLCFLNSYCVIMADRWLDHLHRALTDPEVGIVAASASWESQAEWIRGPIRYWPYQLAGLRRARRDYPRFPNPHLRTSAFMTTRETALQTGLQDVQDKRSAYLLESGRRSITRQVQQRGQRAVVVGRDGNLYDTPEWPASHTYRSGDQQNLLICDNRTRDWRRASPRLRRRLSRDAFGTAGVVSEGRDSRGAGD
jgi:hypothetical protein